MVDYEYRMMELSWNCNRYNRIVIVLSLPSYYHSTLTLLGWLGSRDRPGYERTSCLYYSDFRISSYSYSYPYTHIYSIFISPYCTHNIPPSSLQGTIPFSSASSSSRLNLPYLPTYLPTYLTYQEFRFPPQNLCRKQVNQVKAGQPGPASHSGHTLLLQSVLPLIETSFPLVPPKLAVRYTYSTRNFILHATYFVLRTHHITIPYRTFITCWPLWLRPQSTPLWFGAVHITDVSSSISSDLHATRLKWQGAPVVSKAYGLFFLLSLHLLSLSSCPKTSLFRVFETSSKQSVQFYLKPSNLWCIVANHEPHRF